MLEEGSLHLLRTRKRGVDRLNCKLHILALLAFGIPMVVEARNIEVTVAVKFIPAAVNNRIVFGGSCYDSNVICSSGETFHYKAPKITDKYGSDTWIPVITNGKVVKIKMGNLYAYLGEYCTMNFEGFLAGNICMRRRPQGPPVGLAPSIDP